jgi:hypothetical protein
VRETIPDAVLDRADEVRLIDLSPEELLQRLREGKVYVPAQAERAVRNYFTPSNLTALRELARRETAEHVDDQMQAYMRALAVEGPWPVAEHHGRGERRAALALPRRAARRIAERRNAPWLAVFVESPTFHQGDDAARERCGGAAPRGAARRRGRDDSRQRRGRRARALCARAQRHRAGARQAGTIVALERLVVAVAHRQRHSSQPGDRGARDRGGAPPQPADAGAPALPRRSASAPTSALAFVGAADWSPR